MSRRRTVPGTRIAVEIEPTQHQEKSYRGEADAQADISPAILIQRQNLAECVPRGHDADPRDDRVEHGEVGAVRTELHRPREKAEVENLPKSGKLIAVDPIQ